MGWRRRCGRKPHLGKRYRTNEPHGCVAACGLAQGADLNTSVMPFILRGLLSSGLTLFMNLTLEENWLGTEWLVTSTLKS